VLKIWFKVHGFEACSWTYVLNNLRKGFRDIGVELSDYFMMGGPDNPEEYVELWWGDPQFWEWSDLPVKARVSLALSEARSVLQHGRDTAIRNVGRADLVICPSESAATAFKESPIDAPIKVVFFGADPGEFPFVKRDWTGTIKFLHGGVTQFRKGSWMVPEAFLGAFGDRSDVHLTIASPKVAPMFLKMKQEYAGHDNITFHNDIEDSAQELYETHHIYVSPHLSEGFGLMIPEAMLSGMPCLVARCSAPLEFFSDDYGWWVEMSENYAPVSQCLPDTGGLWRIPSLESLKEGMQRAVATIKESEQKGIAASDYVRHSLSWQHTARGIVEAIEEVLDERDFGSDASVERGASVISRSEEYQPTR